MDDHPNGLDAVLLSTAAVDAWWRAVLDATPVLLALAGRGEPGIEDCEPRQDGSLRIHCDLPGDAGEVELIVPPDHWFWRHGGGEA